MSYRWDGRWPRTARDDKEDISTHIDGCRPHPLSKHLQLSPIVYTVQHSKSRRPRSMPPPPPPVSPSPPGSTSFMPSSYLASSTSTAKPHPSSSTSYPSSSSFSSSPSTIPQQQQQQPQQHVQDSLSISTFNILAPCYKRMQDGGREADFPEYMKNRAIDTAAFIRYVTNKTQTSVFRCPCL